MYTPRIRPNIHRNFETLVAANGQRRMRKAANTVWEDHDASGGFPVYISGIVPRAASES